MFLVNQISTGLILVELFIIGCPNYHRDYYDELRAHVTAIERSNPRIGAREFCVELISCYLNSSSSRFKFAKKFIEFCKSLAI